MEVSRRTAIKTGAALLLPTWLLTERKAVKHIDLSPFCDVSNHVRRYDMTTPFWQAGQTYATDAKVCVRTHLLASPPASAIETRRPRAAERSVGWLHDEANGWRSLRQVTRQKHDSKWTCPTCCGIGHHEPYETCPKCNGNCFLPLSDDQWEYEKPCECYTGYVGRVKCVECRGTGRVNYVIRLATERYIAPEYHAKLLTLGDVDFALPESSDKPAMVRFDGGEGLVMGITVSR